MKFSEFLRKRGEGHGPTPGFKEPKDSIGRWCYLATHDWTADTVDAVMDEYTEAVRVELVESTKKDHGEQ